MAHWRDTFEKAGLPYGPVNDLDHVLADPHVAERGMRLNVKHKFDSELSLIRNALRFLHTPITDYRAAPLLGEHTLEVWPVSLAMMQPKSQS